MTAELRIGLDHAGSGLLTLANVVWNEAGDPRYGFGAKEAVAYAYLNRTGGTVREPIGQEISHYKSLTTRWDKFKDGDRLSFLAGFSEAVRAASERLSDTDPSSTDPTQGATHWVSPAGLGVYTGKPDPGIRERYPRTVGTAENRSFPAFARDPASPEAKKLIEKGAFTKGYQELTVPGVPAEHFLFYTGVRY